MRPRYSTSTRSQSLLDHREVVTDEEDGGLELALQFLQQQDDLALDGDVQGADGFVADQQLRFQDHRAGDADALGLATAELVGKAG